jgi:hypothetical protein
MHRGTSSVKGSANFLLSCTELLMLAEKNIKTDTTGKGKRKIDEDYQKEFLG